MTPLARSGPPFVTDDPETPEWHEWEINILFTWQESRDKREMQMPLFDINYGFKPDIQLKAEFLLLYVDSAREGRQFGLGDPLVGLKWRFLEEAERRPQFAFYSQAIVPTGDSKRGLRDGKPSYLIPLVGQKSWEKWTLYGNLGYTIQTAMETPNFWYSGIVLSRDISERLKLGAELFWNSQKEAEGSSDYAFNVGGELKLSDRYLLLFSAGRSLREGRSLLAYLGIQIVLKGARKRGNDEQGDSENK